MSDYEQLVKALRWCSVDECVSCEGCPMDEETHGTGCFNIMHQRAAAAIEALQAEVEELKAKKMKLAENSLRFVGEVRELDKRRYEPKRGKWVHLYKNNYRCSVCGAWFVFEDENNPYEDGRFCSYCGAKMTEVQE